MEVTEASSLLTEFTLTSSGVISYSNTIRPLHVEGNQIKDNLGNVVHLRGVQKGKGAVDPSGHWGATGKYLQSKVDLILGRMHYYGFNCFRHFTAADFWISNPEVATESGTMKFQDELSDLLTRAENKGLYVILAPYKLRGYPEQQLSMAYPPYCVDPDGNIVESLPQIQNGNDFRNFIVDIVDKLGSHVNLIIEPWNEPFGKQLNWNTYQSIMSEWRSVWQSIIDAVRAKEHEKGYVHHLIIIHLGYGLGYWGLDRPWANFNWHYNGYTFTDHANNLVYSIHAYRHYSAVGTEDPKPTDYTTIKNIYIEQKVYDISLIKPVIVGEIGAYNEAGEEEWLQNTLRIWNEWEIGYTAVHWRDDGTVTALLQDNTESVTGGTVNSKGQKVVDAVS